jgi:TM2 domain-containing membrane protein YozV
MVGGERPERVRASSEERETAIRALGEHLTAGRLDMAEYTERVGNATAARTVGELDVLFVDLPGPHYHSRVPYPAGEGSYPAGGGATMPRPAGSPAHGYPPDPVAPYGYDPYGRPYSDRSKVIAGVLQIVLPIGIGRFYAGRPGLGLAQLLVALLTLGLGTVWSFIDGILLLVQGGTDGQDRPLWG